MIPINNLHLYFNIADGLFSIREMILFTHLNKLYLHFSCF